MSDQLEKLLAQATIKQPSKQWRNWYKTIWPSGVRELRRNSRLSPCGEIDGADKVWPSKEIAEQKAAEYMGDTPATLPGLTKDRTELYEYLGAFPEGERP